MMDYYYLATTTWRSELIMMRSETLTGLKTPTPVQIYAETDPSRCCNMRAPEFYLLDGSDGKRWYYYYSAGTSGTLDNQRTHVLESVGTDPMGPYEYKGRFCSTQLMMYGQLMGVCCNSMRSYISCFHHG